MINICVIVEEIFTQVETACRILENKIGICKDKIKEFTD